MTRTDPPQQTPAGSLASGYQSQSGEMMVYGGTFFGLFLLLGAVMSGAVALYALSLLMLAGAFHFFPMVRTDRVQLRVAPRGLYLDGLGWLPWTAIRDVRMYDRAVRTIRNTHLELKLAAGIAEVVVAEDRQEPLRDLMTRIWSVSRARDGTEAALVTVKLEPLTASPEEILAAIRRYLPGI